MKHKRMRSGSLAACRRDGFRRDGILRVANAQDTIKVGILHSLSGTMAISETTLKDTDPDDDRRAKQEGRIARQEA